MARNQENDANRVLNMQHLQEGHDIKVTQWVFSRRLAMMGTKTRLNEDVPGMAFTGAIGFSTHPPLQEASPLVPMVPLGHPPRRLEHQETM
jgi:hypothetical protein